MNLIIVLLIGGIMGALDGIGISAAPDEPYKIEIFLAAMLKGMLVSLVTALSLTNRSAPWQGAGYGLLYGSAFAVALSAVNLLKQSCRTRLAAELTLRRSLSSRFSAR
jgi:formate/nitrite transporter FocA (FNT family)